MLFLLMTALAVSVDAFVAGLAYNLKRKMSVSEVVYAGSFTFFMCVIALLLGKAIIRFIPFISIIGAIVFIILGLKNFCFSEEISLLSVKSKNTSVGFLGIAVATDASIACLTLNVEYSLVAIYALVMCAGHTLFLGLSRICVRFNSQGKVLSWASGLLLIFIGLSRIL